MTSCAKVVCFDVESLPALDFGLIFSVLLLPPASRRVICTNGISVFCVCGRSITFVAKLFQKEGRGVILMMGTERIVCEDKPDNMSSIYYTDAVIQKAISALAVWLF